MTPSAREPRGGAPVDASELTAQLAAARDGDRGALDRVFALVHEAYLKLGGDAVVAANDRVHFFAGLKLEEIAVLETSERTLKRAWSAARVFLLRELAGPSAGPVVP